MIFLYIFVVGGLLADVYSFSNYKHLMNKLIILFLLLFFSSQFGFTQGFAFEAGYKNIKTNHLQVGVFYRISSKSHHNPWNVSAGLLTDFNQTNSLNVGIQKRFLEGFDIGFNLSKNYSEPTFGFNFLNILRINTGYSIPFEKNYFRGFTFGISISFGQHDYYDELKFTF